MKTIGRIITIGLSPCWDVSCELAGWRWSVHREITGQTICPAGKSLNVSRVLAELGSPNTAAGLWGDMDHSALLKSMAAYHPALQCRFTVVPGHTRINVTLIETRQNKEAHLRAPGSLATKASLRQLQTDLVSVVRQGSICVFSGAMPDEDLMCEVLGLIDLCRQNQAWIVVDTSGPALKAILNAGKVWMIKPNVDEFCELIGRSVKDTCAALLKSAQPLLSCTDHILVSRGRNGTMLVSRRGAWSGRAKAGQRPVQSTVACGDYLLAGYLHGRLRQVSTVAAMKTAIQTATLRAWGWTHRKDWPDYLSGVDVSIDKLAVCP